MGGKAIAHGLEVDRPVMLVNLHGVAATEGDVRPACACQVGEIAFIAYRTPLPGHPS
jgi:hypothetical protein